MFPIQKIIIHCSATQNGKSLATKKQQTAAQVIDGWHKQRGYSRIGYHYVIDTDGTVEIGRKVGEIGAHCKGHNKHSIGICLVGGVTKDGKNHGEYTAAQWKTLHKLLRELESQHPRAKIYGHRDLSPDLNGDGTITPNEWLKSCPCFDVWGWLDSEQVINYEHLFEEEQ